METFDIRPDWDSYFLNIAEAVSLRASCPRASCGIVFVDNITKRILATGYNGAPSGEPDCLEAGCLTNDGKHCKRAVHGEKNAILFGDKYNIDYSNTTMYEYYEATDEQSQRNYYPTNDGKKLMSDYPCLPCRDSLLSRGVNRIMCFYGNNYVVTYEK